MSPGKAEAVVRLGMMQPYFFPYVGYFSLIHAVDHWIVFDTPQYIRRGWVNRNRVLSDGAAEWKYVRVPVLHAPRETAIQQIHVDEEQLWQTQLLQNLDVYERRRAPFLADVRQWLAEILITPSPTPLLSPLLVRLLQHTCRYLDLPFRFQLYSELQLPPPEIPGPGIWALQTSVALGASCYINPPGGREIFNPDQFRRAGVQLRFLQPQLRSYSQKADRFVAGLSIIDVLMWNSPEQVRQLIASYQLESS